MSKPAPCWSSTFRSPGPANMPLRSAWTVSWPAVLLSQRGIHSLNRSRSESRTMTRDEALALMHEYTASDALRKHMYAVEIAMRAMAERSGEDPDVWGLV